MKTNNVNSGYRYLSICILMVILGLIASNANAEQDSVIKNAVKISPINLLKKLKRIVLIAVKHSRETIEQNIAQKNA